MAGLYIHIPFCHRKCYYCSFYSVGNAPRFAAPFISALISEANARLPHFLSTNHIDTIYIGGGTPSLLTIPQFHRVTEEIVRLTGHPSEFTIEVNPDDVTQEMAEVWRGCGINRVSMGVQSLQDAELRAIGRRHDAASAVQAFETLRDAGFQNISLDIMFGLPGQTPDTLRNTLHSLITMNPEHISAYSLTFEERTALYRMRSEGKVKEADDVDSELMWRIISETLAKNGYEQYEISNYARLSEDGKPSPYRSRHNTGYWLGSRYIGLGPSAHSYDGTYRRSNHANLRAYIDYWSNQQGEKPCEYEKIDKEMAREEMIMTRLRMAEGISLSEYERRFGARELNALLRKAEPYLREEHPRLQKHDIEADTRLALTKEGVMVSDSIIVDLF